MLHAVILEQLEFGFIAMAIWHIPVAPQDVELPSSPTSYAPYSRRLAGSSYDNNEYGNVATFTPVEQMRANVRGSAFGFSFFLGLNCLLYVGRWLEILTDLAASVGA